MSKKVNSILAGILAFHLFLLANTQFTVWPEIMSFPHFWQNGFTLYKDFIFVYPPLLVFFLRALFGVFGYKVIILKIFTWGLILVADYILFLLIRKLTKSDILAFLFLGIYIILHTFLDGNMLWFDTALTSPLLLSIYLIDRWLDSHSPRDILLASATLTVASLIKQTAPVYFLAGTVFLAIFERKKFIKQIKYYVAPPFVGFGLLSAYLMSTDSWVEFWNWNLVHPMKYWINYGPYVDYSLSLIEERSLIFFTLLLIPTIFVFRKLIKDKIFVYLFLLLFGTLLATYPRFSFFHLQPGFAVLVLIYAKITGALSGKTKPFYIVGVILVASVLVRPIFPFVWQTQDRFAGDKDLELAGIINENTEGEDTVFLLGVNSIYYTLADKVPPKPWVDNFGWYYMAPGIEDWQLEGIALAKPKSIFVRTPGDGGAGDLGVFLPKKLSGYIFDNYELKSEVIEGIELWQIKD